MGKAMGGLMSMSSVPGPSAQVNALRADGRRYGEERGRYAPAVGTSLDARGGMRTGSL
jgi:hypothetical protein